MLAVLCFLVATCATSAFADDQPIPFEPTPAEVQKAEETPLQVIDSQAASELPRRDLGRDEALELMQSVFGSVLEGPAGIFNDLHIERFLSNYAAVIPAGEQPEISDGSNPKEPPPNEEATLLESSLPLRTESSSGRVEPVDLGLAPSEGELQPTNPLAEVGIPTELGEGIELPQAGVQIELAGAPEDRVPSTIDNSVAFYPNVATDTDFAIAPTPTGVETFSQLRSAEAPHTQILNLTLPAGAYLGASNDGGAEASLNGSPLMRVLPPTALDANGSPVPVTLAVEGTSLKLSVSPDQSAAYPIVLDPLMEDYFAWSSGSSTAGWASYTTPNATIPNTYVKPEYGCSTYCYLYAAANAGWWTYTNAQNYWNYTVPRFQQDYEAVGSRPTSWIQDFTAGQMVFSGGGEYQTSPGALFAVSNEAGAWQAAAIFPPNQSGGYGVDLGTNHNSKMAGFGLFATQNTYLYAYRYVLVGYSQIILGDDKTPVFGSVVGPSQWVNTQAVPFNLTVTDTGLGAYSLQVNAPGGGAIIGTTAMKAGPASCDGTVKLPCPRTWRGVQDGNLVNYNPTTLAQGTNKLSLTASDPVGNKATAYFEVNVDHTVPELAPLSGSMTEQAVLGKTLPQYKVHLEAKDGTTASPQSGIASAEVKVDGKQVKSWSPGCASQNCSLSQEWTLNSSEYSVGKHTIEVSAIDAVGLKSSTRTVSIEVQRDTTMPTVTGSGPLISGPEGWIEQHSYAISAKAEDPKGYGATKLQLKIDGSVVGTSTQVCAAGACLFSHEFTVNTGTKTGGAHTVQLVATDGAGNSKEASWGINIDPKGQVSPGEVADTLEAVEETSEEEPVASTSEYLEAQEIAAGDNPGFKDTGAELESTGIPDKVVVNENPVKGFTVEGNDGAIEVVPMVPPGAGAATGLTEGVAAVNSNAAVGIDSVVRPEFNGAMTFEAIREATSPEAFSWHVFLGTGQTLKADNPQQAEVDLKDGTEAFLITAEPAHDATGATVPTKLEVHESILTLVVEHHTKSFVYPVIAGQSYETSYSPPNVITAPVYEGPPPPPEEGEPHVGEILTRAQAERRVMEEDVVHEDVVVPAPPSGGEASISIVRTFTVKELPVCQKDHCAEYRVYIRNPSYERGFNWVRWEAGTQVHCGYSQSWIYAIVSPYVSEHGCDFTGPSKAYKDSGEHLTIYARFLIEAVSPELISENHLALQVWVYPNGYQHPVVTDWVPNFEE
jgi:hypothetical protein